MCILFFFIFLLEVSVQGQSPQLLKAFASLPILYIAAGVSDSIRKNIVIVFSLIFQSECLLVEKPLVWTLHDV